MQKKYRYSISGFSLIELMIVVTIIGILATIAIPSYQDYTRRARFTEVIAATAPFKTAISLALQEGIPKDQCQIGTHGIPLSPKKTKNLSAITIENGTIIATAGEIIGNINLILIPSDDGSQWEIDNSSTCLKANLCDEN